MFSDQDIDPKGVFSRLGGFDSHLNGRAAVRPEGATETFCLPFVFPHLAAKRNIRARTLEDFPFGVVE